MMNMWTYISMCGYIKFSVCSIHCMVRYDIERIKKYFLNITAWENYSWLNEPQIWIDFTHQNGLRSVSINNSPINIQRCLFLSCNIPLIWSIVFRFCADRLLWAFIGRYSRCHSVFISFIYLFVTQTMVSGFE